MRRPLLLMILMAGGSASAATAQSRLTLPEAIDRAQSQNLTARASVIAEREADERVVQARAGYLPKVDLAESWQRGNQPVFVFSFLLSQRQFTAANFAIDALNNPDPINNFRTALTLEQSVYSPSLSATVRAARVGRELAAAERTSLDHDLAVSVTDAYGRVLAAVASARTATAALEAARADRARAADRRDAGRVTDVDVLQLDVYVARVQQQQIRAAGDERVGRATLNQLMGQPLDAAFVLEPAPVSGVSTPPNLTTLDAQALANRPDITIANLREQQAIAARETARAAFLPQVGAQLGWEMNGGQWDARASSWVVGAVARVNLFQGFADRARLAEARAVVARRALEREQAEAAVRLEVRVVLARLDEASARLSTGLAGVAQARESQRIIRDRYESGLADVVALLRAAEAVQEADTQQIAAQIDVMLAGAALDHAMGKKQ